MFSIGLLECSLIFLASASNIQQGELYGVNITPPSTPLVWGDINILHTTDTHGWLAGHTKNTPPEPNYSGDLGMFSSFITHLQSEAERRGVDLLLVDSGDLHDGNGLTDGFSPGDVNGHQALKLLLQLPYDVMAIGNHEVYKYEVAFDMHANFASKLNGRYLTSNVNITINKEGQNCSIPLGSRFRKFKTKRGRSVTAFGVLFNFRLNSENTTVQAPEDMVAEKWFQETIAEEPDIFLLVGHMAVRGSAWPIVFDAIRTIHPYTPILIFGGHTHIRDCAQLDDRSMSLASGQYMETIGWMSVGFNGKGKNDEIQFGRRYLDANIVSYEYHTGLIGQDFHTKQGKEITKGLAAISEKFNLSYQFGIAPDDFFLDRGLPTSNSSLASLYINKVLPLALGIGNTRSSIPKMFLANTGILRGDIFKGPFTRNDQFIVSPFTNSFEYLPNISWHVASQLVDELNHSGLPSLRTRWSPNDMVDQSDSNAVYRQWRSAQRHNLTNAYLGAENLTLGYVTHDACPGRGDDVPHVALPFHPIPPFIGSIPPKSKALDLVFVSFVRNSVLEIVNTLNARDGGPNVTIADIKPYSDVRTDQVFGLYAQAAWN